MEYAWAHDYELVGYDPTTGLEFKTWFKTKALAREWFVKNRRKGCTYDVRLSAMSYLATER